MTPEVDKYMSIEEIIAPFKSVKLPKMAGKTLNSYSGNHCSFQVCKTTQDGRLDYRLYFLKSSHIVKTVYLSC